MFSLSSLHKFSYTTSNPEKTHSSNIISCESVARASENIGPFSAQNRACSEASSHPIKLCPHLGFHFLPLFRISTSKSSGDLRHKRAEGKPNYSYRDICEREVDNSRVGSFADSRMSTFQLFRTSFFSPRVIPPYHFHSPSHPLTVAWSKRREVPGTCGERLERDYFHHLLSLIMTTERAEQRSVGK